MNNKLTKQITKYHQTDKKNSLVKGVIISLILIATPFLFYTYKFAPSDTKEWSSLFGTIDAGNFSSVQSFIHALFTKITFVMLTGIWFLTSNNWWKFAILVPLTMFLFQLSGIINYQLKYIDEYDFWYSLPFIIPILLFIIYISIRLSKRTNQSTDLKSDVDDEIDKILSDKL